ncbi:hypothetical protein RRSWK_04894 [Rhodopirellula sp. SWK7]|nr:hypothetical protein RRSWK_04894 [Rhodopirellula sp. SWK7]
MFLPSPTQWLFRFAAMHSLIQPDTDARIGIANTNLLCGVIRQRG